MKVETKRGFGYVEHPETGEQINVQEPFETDKETFELLKANYPGFRIVEGDKSNPEGSDDTSEETTCKGNDGECSRTVEDNDYCWQHK